MIGAGREVLLGVGHEVLLSDGREVILSAGLSMLSSKGAREVPAQNPSITNTRENTNADVLCGECDLLT